MKYIQKENLITPSYLSRLNDLVSGMNGFPWYFLSEDVSYTPSKDYNFGDVNLMDIPDKEKTVGFVHVLMDREGVESPWLTHFMPLCDAINDAMPHRIVYSRIRLALLLQQGDNQPQHNAPHTDHEEDHYAGLFYLDDYTGDTVFFDQYDDPRGGDVEHRWWRAMQQEYTIAHSNTPKRNSLFVFDGHQFHASSNPYGDCKFRVSLNLNFTSEHDLFADT